MCVTDKSFIQCASGKYMTIVAELKKILTFYKIREIRFFYLKQTFVI